MEGYGVEGAGGRRGRKRVGRRRRYSSESEGEDKQVTSQKRFERVQANRSSNNGVRRRVKQRHRSTKKDPELHRRKSDLLREDDSDVELDSDGDESQGQRIERLMQKFDENKYKGRMAVVVLAIVLLWSTSFAVCRAFIRLMLQSPSFDEIEAEVLSLEDQTNDQSAGYVDCVNREFDFCNNTYQTEKDEEVARFTAILTENADHLNALSELKAECSNLNVQMNEIISSSSEAPGNHIFDTADPQTCSASAVNLASQRQAQAAQAVAVGEATDQAAQSALDDFQRQIDERRAYDEEYFGETLPNAVDQLAAEAAEKLPSVDELNATLSAMLLEYEACYSNETVFDAEGNRVDCQFTKVSDAIAQQVNELTESFEEYSAVFDEYADTYERMEELATNFRRVVDNADIGVDVNTGVFAFDDDLVNFDDFKSDFPDFNTDQFNEELAQVYAEMEAAKEERLADLEALIEELEELNANFSANLTAGYNPPNFTNITFNTDLAGTLADNLDFVPDTTVDERVEEAVSNAKEGAADLLSATIERDFSLYNYPESYYTSFKNGLVQISDLSVLFDTIYRIMQSILLIRKYWTISGINTPPANMQADDASVFKPKDTQLQAAVKIITNPLVILFLMVLSLVAIISLIYIAYNPLYSAYVEGCLEHTFEEIPEEAEGTMIFRNAYSISLNLASRDGNALIVTNVDQLNAERQLACTDFFSSSLEQRDDQNSTYLNLVDDVEKLGAIFGPYDECVDWDEFDADGGTEVADIMAQSVTLGCNDADAILSDERFTVQLSDDVALYQCQDIPECVIDCTGVDLVTMQKTSFDASCTAEWGLHSYFLIGLLSFFMYLCLNISRFYVMRGVIAAFWQSISLDLFSYQGSCRENGSIVLPAEITTGEARFRDMLEERLQHALKRFQLSGWFEIVLAISMNLPWIVFLAIVAPNLRYESQD
eukprot:snap_masked-scaffold_12-processed-gene-1.18-mRNA-1 protein AED:1.00 eAED:1.00 QI:0/-1/0/0/-1/1/1/0/943